MGRRTLRREGVRVVKRHEVKVFQQGTSQRHVARCTCGWEVAYGSMQAVRDAAREHAMHPDTTQTEPTQAVEVATPPAPGRQLEAAANTRQGLAIWNAEQVNLIRAQICPDANDNELAFFATVCQHRQLDPFEGEIVGIKRGGVMKVQVTVEGLRTVAMRTGFYAGQDEPMWRAKDGDWDDIWPGPGVPFAAKVAVYRTDNTYRPAAVGKAHYSEFVQLDGRGNPTPMWKKMPANQLAKCAERQALIRAFKREMQAAGIDVSDLSAPSRISMEARRVGLDDDGRHALVERVTNGTKTSTRDLDDDEVYEVRAEIARQEADVELVEDEPDTTNDADPLDLEGYSDEPF